MNHLERTASWFLRDHDGHFSWRRGAGMIAIDALVAALVADWCGHKIDGGLIQCFAAIVMTSIVGATAESFRPKGPTDGRPSNPPAA